MAAVEIAAQLQPILNQVEGQTLDSLNDHSGTNIQAMRLTRIRDVTSQVPSS